MTNQIDVMIEMAKDSDKLESENFLEKVNNILWPKPLGEILKEAGITIDEETRKRNFEDGIRHIQG